MKKNSFTNIKDILKNKEFISNLVEHKSNVTQEFQDFGLRLSNKLNDRAHKSLYIKLSQSVPRHMLEKAEVFARDYPTKTNNKGRIFMWKLKEVCKLNKYAMKLPKSKFKKKVKVKELNEKQISFFNGL